MDKNKNISTFLFFYFLYSVSLNGTNIAPFSIVNFIDPPIIFNQSLATDSLKNKSIACNFTPSLWLKGDEGVTLSGNNVTAWADQSGNANNASQNANNRRPSFQATAINFNPALDFDGANDFIQGNGGASNTTLFMVARSDLAVTRTTPGQTILTANITNPASNSYFFSIGSVTAAFNNEVITHGLGHSGEYRKVLTGNFSIPNVPHLYSTDHNNSTSNAVIYYDGAQIDNNTANTFINSETNRSYRIGGNLYVWGGIYFNGKIAEILSFPTNLTTDDREIVQSYLGIKYGISLSHAFKDADGLTIWNESGYANNIASIGRDDCFGLNQKQTKNAQTGAILTMGLGSIANSNVDNTNTFNNDKSFLFWGNDNDDDGVVEEINTELPAGVQNRLDREWKIRNTNNVGAVEIQFDLNGITNSATTASDLFLLIDEDGNGNFNNGTIQKIAATSFTNGIVSFSTINLADGVVITLATTAAPNNAPQITCPSTTLEVCPNGQQNDIATSIQVTDLDNDNLTAQITITGITDNSDILSVDLTGFSGITQTYNYPTLQITGNITPMQLQTILQTLIFSTTSTLAGVRDIRILINDTIENSNEIVKAIQADENLSICCSANAPLISN